MERRAASLRQQYRIGERTETNTPRHVIT